MSVKILRWKKALVVYVLGSRPPFHVMKKYFDRKLVQFGGMKVYILKTGVYIVVFQDVETRYEVLEAGPWSFDNKPLIVNLWSPEVNLEREEMSEVPVWVRFPNLRLYMWSELTLSKLASMISTPLFTDKMTAKRERLTYARVCIGVKVGMRLHEEIIL